MLLPLHIGGGPTQVQATYAALRSAEGVGGSAADDSGIDGLWRRSIAIGLDACRSPVRRAVNNGFPHLATDLVPYYEGALGLIHDPSTTQEDGRRNSSAMWPTKSSAAFPDIEAGLRRIDPRFSLIITPGTVASTSLDGRWFGSHDGATEEPEWNGSSYLAGETTSYMLTAFLDVADPENVTPFDLRAVSAASEFLRRVQPSWWGFEISVTDDGFTLDESPLDLTGLTDDE